LRDPSHAQLSIADMSFELGFSDVTTFTRAFKRYVGVTPSDWRLGDRAIADVSV
jgi:AraC-like DNA-binding protein